MRVGIIGGGIHGAATAYFLKRHGVDDVFVFEQNNIGGGSTGYSAGIIRYHYTNKTHINITLRSSKIIKDLEEYVGQTGGYHQNGYLILYPKDEEAELKDIVARQQSCGVDVTLVESTELQDYLPGIYSDDSVVGAFERNAGFADPYLVTTGFAKKAQDMGATFHTNTKVTDLHHEGDRIEYIETAAGTHDVDYVINAAGKSGAKIARMAGLSLPLEICESKIVVLTSERDYQMDYPTLSDHSMETDFYTKPESSGDFIIGGIDRPKIDEKTGKEGVSEDFLMQVMDRLEKRLPGYADASVIDSWSGGISVTPDSNQIIGEPQGLNNFFNLVGGSGHGFKTAPAFAEATAKKVAGKDPGYDLSQYRLERFTEGEHLYGVSSKTYSTE